MLQFDGRSVEELALEHEVSVDTRTGALAVQIPIECPTGRGGAGPQLTLGYAVSAGATAFGVGWSLSGVPAIGIDTGERLPRWDGADPLQLGGAEIVPWLEERAGAWVPRTSETAQARIELYRLRTAGSAVRIERWTDKLTGRIHFRTRDAQNVLTIFGARPGSGSRVQDPDDDARTFSWLPELRLDPRGNAIWIDYASEDLRGVDRGAPAEVARRPSAQRYLKRIRYGNARPLTLDDDLVRGVLPADLAWCFHLVLDYGDHAPGAAAAVEPDRAWPARPDPTSTFRPGFDVRTHRLCRRLLTFHHFAALGDAPVLVTEHELDHALDPAGSTLRSIRRTGHRTDGGVRQQASLPSLVMTYAPPATGAFAAAPAETTANVPAGLSGSRYSLIDLFGEGLPGILAQTDGAWYWKPNLGDGRFGAQVALAEKPAAPSAAVALGDHDQDGDTDLAQLSGRITGMFELDREAGRWQGFQPLGAVPHVEALGGRAQWVDLDGDGRPDLVIARADGFVWFPSGPDGFTGPIEVPRPPSVPATLEDLGLDFFFADMNGDGLPDLVRVQNGRVEYWPNLGNGRFADGVVLDDSPWLAADGELDTARVRFVDLDGSGTADLLYLGRGEVRAWINAGGNRFVPGPHLRGLPYVDNASACRIADLLGDGRPCLTWSTPLPNAEAPLQYLPLVPEVQPRALIAIADSRGAETRVTWGHSARHYLRDEASGRGWSSKLPTHVAVVDRIEELDLVGGTRSATRYEYHDGFYDGAEREWRGFGQVDVLDADADAGTAPALTRSWFHLGVEMWNHRRPFDAYDGDPDLPLLPPHVRDASLAGAPPAELDDALATLAGQLLRREVFAVDGHGRRAAHPISVAQSCARVRKLQPAHRGHAAAFAVVSHEDLTASYEQAGGDPRVESRILVATDAFDQPLRDAEIAYARRGHGPDDAPAQHATLVTVHDHTLVNLDLEDRFELGIPIEGRDLELVLPAARVTAEALRAPEVEAVLAAPAAHDAVLGDTLGARLLSWERSYYWNDARDAALPHGAFGALTLVHHEESAVATPAFLASVYGDRVDAARMVALGYIFRDGHWWRADDVHVFGPAARFWQREGFDHRDGTATRLTFDGVALELVAATDPSGNRTTAEIDYHVLAPWRLTDPNGAVAEVRYDALGAIAVETQRGAIAGAPWGMDPLAAYAPRPAPAGAAAVVADPAHYLQGAARFTYYDLAAWTREGAPIATVTLAAEELRADGAGGGTSAGRIAVTVGHLDGLGRVLQTKQLVDPGDAIARGADGEVVVDASGHPVLAPATTRWLASGHVTYDRKQQPVAVHEPFHTAAWQYEGDDVLARSGVATIELHDAVGRVVRRSFPNGTFERTTYLAWSIERADANDTVFESTYRLLREGRPAGDPERQAYEHALAHRDTTTTVILDVRGAEVATIERGGGTLGERRTEARLDIEGQVVAVVDARGLTAFTHRRDMEGREVHVRGMDAGDTWTLFDADDRIATAWTAAGYTVDHAYDVLDRPRSVRVRGHGLDHRVEEYVYGEDLPVAEARARNLRGRLVVTRDQAGEHEIDHCDPGRTRGGCARRRPRPPATRRTGRAPSCSARRSPRSRSSMRSAACAAPCSRTARSGRSAISATARSPRSGSRRPAGRSWISRSSRRPRTTRAASGTASSSATASRSPTSTIARRRGCRARRRAAPRVSTRTSATPTTPPGTSSGSTTARTTRGRTRSSEARRCRRAGTTATTRTIGSSGRPGASTRRCSRATTSPGSAAPRARATSSSTTAPRSRRSRAHTRTTRRTTSTRSGTRARRRAGRPRCRSRRPATGPSPRSMRTISRSIRPTRQRASTPPAT